MNVEVAENLAELEEYRERWDELAGCGLFRSWTWLSTWWRHYGENQPTHQLHVLLVFRDDSERNSPDSSPLVAILPCYLHSSVVHGRTLRLLGDGEVCSDYMDLLVAEKFEEQIAETLALYLTRHADAWDCAEFRTSGEASRALTLLISRMQAHGCHGVERAGESCWAVELPESWEEMMKIHSRSHRKKLGRLERRMHDAGEAKWYSVQTPDDFEKGWQILEDLHQKRRISLGEAGCFASKRWASFHREMARTLLDAGELRLSWLELDGTPIAVEYNFARAGTTYAYQGGLDPTRMDLHPGRLSLIYTMRQALDEGHQRFDFLRGDEPYKLHWRAEPEHTSEWEIVPDRMSAQIRHALLSGARSTRTWLRQVLRRPLSL